MTKIKNTKKGMAKKTLSVSLAVAMLATSNVPVWAAEFSDGADAAFTSEVEAPVVEEAATPETTDDSEEVAVAYASSDYDFSNVVIKDKVSNPTWAWKTAAGTISTVADFFVSEKSTVKMANGTDYTSGLGYVWAYNGEWNGTATDLSDKNLAYSLTMPTAPYEHVGESLSLLLVEKSGGVVTNQTPVARFDFGTIQPVDINDAGLSVALADSVQDSDKTYTGKEKKLDVKITTTAATSNYGSIPTTVDDYTWSYSGTDGLIDAGSVITVSGEIKAPNKLYTGRLTTTYEIKKAVPTDSNLIIKVANPGKEFTYTGNSTQVIDKSEVNVYLIDPTTNEASNILLNDFVKEVTLDSSSLTASGSADPGRGLTVKLDGAKIYASKNFKTTAGDKTDISNLTTESGTVDGKSNTVKVVALDLSDITVTLTTPQKGAKYDSNTTLNTGLLTFTKDGKTLNLGSEVTAKILAGDYRTPSTYTNKIMITGNGTTVQGVTYANLVTRNAVFASGAKFVGGTEATVTNYLTTTKSLSSVNACSYGLDYNNGNPVEFADILSTKGILGVFDPTGTATTGDNIDQTHFRVKYQNNTNVATSDSNVAVLTVYAVSGDYEGCSKDFYFKINPSNVKPTNAKDTTVTTNATTSTPGVEYKDAGDNDAAAYAEAIGLKVNGVNNYGADETKKIISNATTADYTVNYSFATKSGANYTDVAIGNGNEVGKYVKAVITLKKDGNFKITNSAVTTPTRLSNLDTGVEYTTTAAVNGTNNGVITLYVKILDKSIENADITLSQTSYAFTGKTIEPKVSVKIDGKEYKEGRDYTVKVENGINVGTAKVIVTMNESTGYRGSKTLEATITPAKLSDVTFEIKKADVDGKTFTYNGKQQKPAIAQDDDPATTKIETVDENTQATAQVKLGNVVISKMFDISYGKNIDAGKAAGTVTLTPKASVAKNFEGSSVTANFDIYTRTLKNTSAANWAIKLVNDDGVILSRDRSGATPSNKINTTGVDIEWTGNTAVFSKSSIIADRISQVTPPEITNNLGTDDYTYELAYANNVEATTSDAPAFVCIVGTGNFGGSWSIVKESATGKVEAKDSAQVASKNKETPGTYEVLLDNVLEDSWATFEIEGRSFAAKNVTITNATYAGGIAVQPGSVVKDSKTGKVLVEGTDYELVFDTKNVNATTTPIAVSVKGLGQYKGSFVTNTADGKKLTFCIDKKDLKDCFVDVTKKENALELTVMNGNVTEKTEKFDVKDNGDGTATVSVVDNGKNYTGSVTVDIVDPEKPGTVGKAMIADVEVVGNKATVVLSGDVDNASGYDYVIATEEDYQSGRVDIVKNQIKTTADFTYVQKGTYYAYCHAWTRGTDGKKVFGDWSNIFKFDVYTTTPAQPVITSVKRSGSNVTVTYTQATDADGYDVVLGTKTAVVNGEKRPVNYGTLVKKNVKGDTVTVTFKDVPAGTYYAGLHAWNRSSLDNKKVFSPWSNIKTVTVK